MPTSRPFISLLFGSFSTSYQRNTTTQTSASTATVTTGPTSQMYKMLDNHSIPEQPQQPTLTQTQPAVQTAQTAQTAQQASGTADLSESPHDKLWIGGRSNDGREKFYRLEPAKRRASFDRISLDQVSI
ncbi:hypothetical protein B0I72DRAFT_137412 [Yarrowia lipolytica]|jgi:hypothetical protein|uniref:YALI0C12166p n=2 Tax=Yarrowia lipolytica TaxID=4952 RepID=Q6CC62_YARLI|nr:YALI0C12166p [Yarrowia lipolytica CLIB122]AOW02736.1 hypothetical protein YALI1_C17078g [Yarrowia lipolytica]KAB8282393.1 hypothetical protein BKA91DRAFT_138580 [Yarrowia lipolytica]KAE8171705.1 hypothetical protein BKA90DRAFT_138542 [Yarrowia lipolytica]KAJ8053369.1 hypothetical protein LXG23DRAFT_37531 [Yarrowia lipolytica]QNP96246.1 Hypothetical protein YALI2_B00552g [Yarrowia lipolytica]|eukprot:XP_501750.2 YALI0C12166p [Yarrowia lipolytica CLIB122]